MNIRLNRGFRSRSISALLTSTGLTIFTGLALAFFGKAYDASTAFGPTDEAMRQVVSAGNDELNQQPALTNDARADEAKRIGYGASNANTVDTAIILLSKAGELGRRLELELDSPTAPEYDAVAAAVRAKLEELEPGINIQTWEPPKDDPEHPITQIIGATRIPVALWADFAYLDTRLKYYNISRDFLAGERLADTRIAMAKKVDVAFPDGRTVLLSVRHRDPRVAEVLVNAITAVYKYQYDSENLQSSRKQVQFYAARKAAAERQYVAARNALSQWRKQNSGIFLPDQVTLAVKKGDTARDDLEKLNATLKDLDAQIAAKKARLAATPKMLRRTTRVEDPEVGLLRQRISTLQANLTEKLGSRTENDAEVKRIREELGTLNGRLRQVRGSMVEQPMDVPNEDWDALNRDVASLEQTRRGLAARAATANQVVAESAQRLAQIPQASVDAQAYQNSFTAAGEKLSDLTKKLSNAEEDFRKADDTGALHVQFWAGLPPGTQAHPESAAREGAARKNMAILAAAFILSLLASACIVLGADFFDTSIKTPYDAEHMLDTPVNGIVPRLEGPSRAALPMVTHKLPSSPHAESYRFLGTDILLSATGDDPFKSIMVATAKPGQGGTTTVCNLAITLAQAGQSVVLVDADLRRPSLHRIFGLENDHGLTTVLENGRLPSDVLQRTEVENLYVMTGGPQTDNAWKLLRSSKMKDVILDLSRDFDFVLFDTPSAVVFADAATLATMVDGVLLVVRAHEAPSGSELQVKNLLNKTKARIVGVVLNDMPAEQVDSARFFSHYYAADVKREEIAPRGAKTALPGKSHDDEI